MKLKWTALILAVTTSFAFAGPTCQAPQEKWIKETDFKAQLEKRGYTIKTFKISRGRCYEIYGHDASGKKVEIYFDPATGAEIGRE